MSDQTTEWLLLDEFQPSPSIYEDEDRPQWPIRSEKELRSTLMHFSQREPRMLSFRNSRGCVLGIGIGGGFAAVQCPANLPDGPILVAYANVVRAASNKLFRCEGIDTPFPPQNLLLADEVIEIVVHYYVHQVLAPWVKWHGRYIDVEEPEQDENEYGGHVFDPPDTWDNSCF